MPNVNDNEAFMNWIWTDKLSEAFDFLKTEGTVQELLMEEFNNAWIDHCESLEKEEHDALLKKQGWYKKAGLTYYDSFWDLLDCEFGLELDTNITIWDDQATILGYANGDRFWTPMGKNIVQLDDDMLWDIAWRFTEEDHDENDFIIIRMAGVYRLATTSEFQKFMGA